MRLVMERIHIDSKYAKPTAKVEAVKTNKVMQITTT